MGMFVSKRFVFFAVLALLFVIPAHVFAAKTNLGPKIPVASGKDPDIAIDSKGALHLAYVKGSKTYYRKVFPPYTSKVFGKEHYIGSGTNPQIAIDSKDNPHVVFGKARYAYWNGAKFVEAPQAFVGWRKNLIAIDSKDRVYIIADKYRPRAVLARAYVNGSPINTPVKVGNDNPGGVGVDSSDTLHITWRNGNTYYNTYTLAGGKGRTIRFSESAGDFSWCSVNPVGNSIHAVYTAAYARGMHYIAKRNGVWKNKLHFGYNEVYQHEPDNVNPVSTNDAEGYTYITFRGERNRSPEGYFVVIDQNDKIVEGLKLLDPEDHTDPGRKMTNPNIISNANTKGAFVTWGTSTVYVRSIGVNIANQAINTLPIITSKLLLSKKKNPINPELLPGAVTDQASNVTASGAQLNGTINPKGSATTVIFEWGPASSFPPTNVGVVDGTMSGEDDVEVSYNLTGLEENVTYVYKVVATNGEGVMGGDYRYFTTGSLPTAATLAATSITKTTARLNGMVNPKGEETTVVFEWGVEGDSSPLNTLAVSGTIDGENDTSIFADLSGLTKNTTYVYRIKATNIEGTKTGEYRSFKTLADEPPPAGEPTVTALQPTNVTATTAILRGLVNPNGAETTVHFEAGIVGLGTIKVEAEENPISGSTEQAVTYDADIVLPFPGAEYTYRIVVNNGVGGNSDHDVFSEYITFEPDGSD